MRTVTSLPYAVREDEHIWIPMSDGIRLSARIWRPVTRNRSSGEALGDWGSAPRDDSDEEPVPAVLEFIPYRKRDLTALRDSIHHPYMAGHGYACVRVDLRGTGDSEGVLTDEYLERELLDAEEILAWLADQPWSNGRAGMMGISWGGFNALQVAARRPPSLGAIAALCFSDDRYADDVHYMGGCLLSDNLSWASTMFAYTSCPPDPAVVGERWRDMWRERLEHSGLWLENWLRHQRRDAYWQHASISEDYSDVQCPVLAVSGWADGYSNAVFRTLANLKAPTQGLIGPWSHKYPHLGEPGPAIGFLQELVRWWDHWLKGVDNGVMDEPMLRIWMQETVPPSTAYQKRPGRWVGEPSWPSPRIPIRRYPLERNRIAEEGEQVRREELTVESPLSVGQFAGKWCSYNAPPDLPYDQREEDGGSLVFDSEILGRRCEILGSPVVRLVLAVTMPQAMVAVRLSDVAPDGRATRVTYGLLNLTHRTDHELPRPLEPGQRYDVRVMLNGMAHAFPPGHRMRLSISTSYWPLAWPPPRTVRLALYTGACFLELPVRPIGTPDEPKVSAFGEPEGTRPIATTQVKAGEEGWTVTRDMVNYESALNVIKDLGVVRIDDIDLEMGRRAMETYGWTGDDFTSVFGDVEWRMGFVRGDWDVSTVTRTKLTSTQTDFHLHAQLDAYEADRRFHSRNWTITIPRDQL